MDVINKKSTDLKLNYREFVEKCSNNHLLPLSEEEIKLKILGYLFEKRSGNTGEVVWIPEKSEITWGTQGGVDITLRGGIDGGQRFFIECKGKSNAASLKARNAANKENYWLHALGQLISRMDSLNTAYYYGLGLYWESAQTALRRIPETVAKKLNLRIFSVHENGTVKEFTPKSFGKSYKEDVFM